METRRKTGGHRLLLLRRRPRRHVVPDESAASVRQADTVPCFARRPQPRPVRLRLSPASHVALASPIRTLLPRRHPESGLLHLPAPQICAAAAGDATASKEEEEGSPGSERRGLFKYLASLGMALLEISVLYVLLHFCHRTY